MRLLRAVAGCLLLGVSAWAQEAEPEFVEVRHPATGRVIELVDPAAERNHGEPLPGFAWSGRHPSARLQAAVAGGVPDATVLAAARRFGIGEPERELAFQRAESDGLNMVHEGWEQQWQGVPVFGAGLIVHRNAHGAVTSIGGRVLPNVVLGNGAKQSDAVSGSDAGRAKALDYAARAKALDYSAAVAAARVAAEAAPEFVRLKRQVLAAARRETGDSPSARRVWCGSTCALRRPGDTRPRCAEVHRPAR